MDDFDIYRVNPFEGEMITRLSNLPDRHGRFVSKELTTIDPVGNPLSNEDFMMAEVVKVDPDQFTKVFQKELRGMGLSSKASHLILFMAEKLGKHDMHVDLHYDDIIDDFPISKQTFYRVIKELLLNNIIARTKYSYRFFINPLFMYNGDRLTVVKQYIKEGSDIAKKAIYSDAKIQMIDESIPLDQAQAIREKRLEDESADHVNVDPSDF
jgi:hypothetical protein